MKEMNDKELNDEDARELNEAVARAMGWHFREDPEQGAESYWTLPDGGIDDAPPFGTPHEKHYGDFYALPDFARDVMALGYLAEYLTRTETAFCLDGTDDEPGPLSFTASLYGSRHAFTFQATPGQALARVILHHATILTAKGEK